MDSEAGRFAPKGYRLNPVHTYQSASHSVFDISPRNRISIYLSSNPNAMHSAHHHVNRFSTISYSTQDG